MKIDNEEIDPARVEPVESTEAAPPAGWTHIFPYESVSVISVDRK